jgi:hypothetical protein
MKKLESYYILRKYVTIQFTTFVLIFISKHKELNIQKENVACCFTWVWNLICLIKETTQADGVRKYCAEEAIWV